MEHWTPVVVDTHYAYQWHELTLVGTLPHCQRAFKIGVRWGGKIWERGRGKEMVSGRWRGGGWKGME